MHSYKSFALILFAIVLIFSSCKKESGSGSKADRIQANINGVLWSGNNISWASSGGTAQINAFKSDGTSMQVFLSEGVTGTFDVSDNVATISHFNGNATYSNNVSGTIVITANSSNLIEGTFNVMNASYFVSDTLVMTEGAFKFSF